MSTAQIARGRKKEMIEESGSSTDNNRLKQLRQIASNNPARARNDAWEWLKELQAAPEHYRLPWLFAHGSAPDVPHGDCEGIVMNLYGSIWLNAVDSLVRLGQQLGGIGWTGKSFDTRHGTGYNRLTPGTRLAALFVMPGYRFARVKGELVGFHFFHTQEKSPLPPHPDVRSIRYDAPEHANPLMLPRTRDELVEIVPGVFLGRALLLENGEWQVVGYFGLRQPQGGY